MFFLYYSSVFEHRTDHNVIQAPKSWIPVQHRVSYLLCPLHFVVRLFIFSECHLSNYLFYFSQLPSNLFLRKLGVVHWLAFLVVSWGLVQLSMGFVPTWGYLALTRALLGAFEVRSSSFQCNSLFFF